MNPHYMQLFVHNTKAVAQFGAVYYNVSTKRTFFVRVGQPQTVI